MSYQFSVLFFICFIMYLFSRDVVVSVNFIVMDGNTVTFVAPSKLLRISTTLTAILLWTHVEEVCLMSVSNHFNRRWQSGELVAVMKSLFAFCL